MTIETRPESARNSKRKIEPDPGSDGINERLELTRQQVKNIIEEIYKTQPAWEVNIDYYIDWPGYNWKSAFPEVSGYHREFLGKELEYIELTQQKPGKGKRRREMLVIRLNFASRFEDAESITLKIFNDKSSMIETSVEKEFGGAKYYPITKNKNRGSAAEIIRYIQIAEVLNFILENKQNSSPSA